MSSFCTAALHPHAPPRPVSRPRVSSLLRAAAALLCLWRRRQEEAEELRTMDDHMLRDIGITRAEALAAAARPFWQP